MWCGFGLVLWGEGTGGKGGERGERKKGERKRNNEDEVETIEAGMGRINTENQRFSFPALRFSPLCQGCRGGNWGRAGDGKP